MKPQEYVGQHIHYTCEIIATNLCHHTHFIDHISHTLCVTSYALYIRSHPLLRLYFWHHNLYIWNHIQYIGQHVHYTCEITATNLCHQTHFIYNITPIIYVTSHSAYVWHLLHYPRHHILTLWHQTTIFVTSHPLYLPSYPLYLCHHIHCISDIIPNVFMWSHGLYMTTSYAL